MDKSTIICRCEELTYEEIEDTLRLGARKFDDIKRLTRCGMGPCQAKMCMDLVAELIHQNTNIPYDEIGLPRIRMPLSPIKIEILATGSRNFSRVKSIMDEVEL